MCSWPSVSDQCVSVCRTHHTISTSGLHLDRYWRPYWLCSQAFASAISGPIEYRLIEYPLFFILVMWLNQTDVIHYVRACIPRTVDIILLTNKFTEKCDETFKFINRLINILLKLYSENKTVIIIHGHSIAQETDHLDFILRNFWHDSWSSDSVQRHHSRAICGECIGRPALFKASDLDHRTLCNSYQHLRFLWLL